MPYVKSIPIRSTVNKSIAYILNPLKTDGLLLVAGMNCVPDKTIAYEQFKGVYQRYDNGKNYISGKKKPIKAHHFVQSFKVGDVTQEQASQIAQQWAKQVFGENRQIVISTHIDKEHIHNHFIVNAFDFDGRKFYSNKASLKRARDISDKVCLEHGISPIQSNSRKGVHYKEWMETKAGSSWKQDIRMAIDKAIIKSKDVEDLLNILKEQGFEVKRGKYISIKPNNLERFVRIHKLGEPYSESNLAIRIKNKDNELVAFTEMTHTSKPRKSAKNSSHNVLKKSNYKGLQLKYVSLIQLIADLIVKDQKPAKKYNSRKPYSRENDYDLNKIASHLRLLNRENIESESQLNEKHLEVQTAFTETKASIDKMSSMEENLNGVIKNVALFLELKDKQNISSSEQLKLTIAQSIVKKYNITGNDDLTKLERERDKIRKNKELLSAKYQDTEKRYKEFNDLFQTYKKVSNNTYLQEIQKDRRSRDKPER